MPGGSMSNTDFWRYSAHRLGAQWNVHEAAVMHHDTSERQLWKVPVYSHKDAHQHTTICQGHTDLSQS